MKIKATNFNSRPISGKDATPNYHVHISTTFDNHALKLSQLQHSIFCQYIMDIWQSCQLHWLIILLPRGKWQQKVIVYFESVNFSHSTKLLVAPWNWYKKSMSVLHLSSFNLHSLVHFNQWQSPFHQSSQEWTHPLSKTNSESVNSLTAAQVSIRQKCIHVLAFHTQDSTWLLHVTAHKNNNVIPRRLIQIRKNSGWWFTKFYLFLLIVKFSWHLFPHLSLVGSTVKIWCAEPTTFAGFQSTNRMDSHAGKQWK